MTLKDNIKNWYANRRRRYETFSSRSIHSSDPNFIWCIKCDFGQLHSSGNDQPMIRCLECGYLSCFRHSVPWHNGLTCLEFDVMLKWPKELINVDLGNKEAADVALEKFVKFQEENRDTLLSEEKSRQKQVIAAERQKAKRKQQEEAELKSEKANKQKKMEESNEQKKKVESNEQKKLEESNKLKEGNEERLKMIKEMQRRKRENELSLKTVKATTKQCPGCKWPIEKNQGCAHMACEYFLPSLPYLHFLQLYGMPRKLVDPRTPSSLV